MSDFPENSKRGGSELLLPEVDQVLVAGLSVLDAGQRQPSRSSRNLISRLVELSRQGVISTEELETAIIGWCWRYVEWRSSREEHHGEARLEPKDFMNCFIDSVKSTGSPLVPSLVAQIKQRVPVMGGFQEVNLATFEPFLRLD